MSKKKDPAILFYPANWLMETKGMKPHAKAWYLNLILHHFDQGDLPSDIDELANLADVRISESILFQQTWEQVLQHKFEQKGNGRITNVAASNILTDREKFVKKRGNAGKISQFTQWMRREKTQDENVIYFVKRNLGEEQIEKLNEQVYEQVYEQVLQLYIGTSTNEDIVKIKSSTTAPPKNETEINLILEGYKGQLDNDYQVSQMVAQENGFNQAEIKTAITLFWNTKSLEPEAASKDYADFRRHFVNFCRKQQAIIREKTKGGGEAPQGGAHGSL